MRKIAILNQKGGVGKTTTSVNLAAAFASIGKTVCVIDMDPQAHATLHLGVNTFPGEPSVYNVLTGTKMISEVCRQVADRLFVVGSDIDLAAAEVELAGVVGRELILRDQFELEQLPFDYVIIDCPPSLGVLTINALSAVDEVYIPLQPHFLALHGLSKLLETTHLVSKRLNPKLTLGGVLLCLYEAGTKLASEISQDVVDFLDRSRQDNTPWAHAKVFSTKIRRNIRVAEAPSFGQSILDYAPNSHGALDYLSLAQEILDANAESDARRDGLVTTPVRPTLPLPSAEQYSAESEPVAAAPAAASRKSEGVSFAFKKVMSKRA